MKFTGFLYAVNLLHIQFSLTDHICDRSCGNSQPMTCEYHFTLEWYSTMSKACYDCPLVMDDCFRKDCIAADGFPRDVTVVNRMYPGPSIRVCQNDTIQVRLHNLLDNNEGTAIHWHGLYQEETPWMDGVPLITQCPIPMGTTFVYTFRADPPGTHWWHAHAGFQRSDGVAGPLVVKTPLSVDPHSHLYDVDHDNYTMFVGDWLHQSTMSKYLQHHHSDQNNKGEAILINGRGRYMNTSGNRENASASETPLAEFIVDQGLRYRFRIISNAAVFCPFELTFDHHLMTVVATDGADVKPLNISSLVVHGGERFDVIVSANQEIANYWINVQGMADCANNSQKAILRYSTAHPSDEMASYTPWPSDVAQLNPLNKKETNDIKYVTTLISLNEDESINGRPDDVIFLGFDFKKVNNPKYHDPHHYPIHALSLDHHLYTPQINNVTFSPTSSPLLTQPRDINMSQLCDTHAENYITSEEFRVCPHVINLKLNHLVEVVLFDEGFTFGAGHPMHLHGQHFTVVAMDKIGSNISFAQIKELHASGSIDYNPDLSTAVKKDTVIVPDGGYTVLRFYTKNPGVWLFHCHLSFHVEAGMNLAFRVGDNDDVSGIPQSFPRCGDWPKFETCAESCHCAGNGSKRFKVSITTFVMQLILFAIFQF